MYLLSLSFTHPYYTGNKVNEICLSQEEKFLLDLINEYRSNHALMTWQKSKGHNSVILNLGAWKEVKWKAIGIGIFEGYATVWFGVEADNAKAITLCE